MKRDLASILDALIFCKRIVEFTKDIEEEDFIQDLKTHLSLVWSVVKNQIPELIDILELIVPFSE
jgi:uncharacterized protein with HEPN domain